MWGGTTGMPVGSMKVSVTFSDFKQYVDASINLSSLDLTGKTLHALVMLDSGAFTGGGYLTWMDLTLDLTAAQGTVTGFAANDIRQIGVQFATGDPYEGGSFTSPIDVVFHGDSITAQ